MPLTVPLIGKELCFWCIEAFRSCPIHENSNVFWNDVTVRSYSGESDGFRIVEEKELNNVERNAYYTETGSFVLPPNGSTLLIRSTFHFERFINPPRPEVSNQNDMKRSYAKVEKVKNPKPFKVPKLPKEKGQTKKNYYTKIHQNAIKTMAAEYKKGKKCDQSQKLFLCDLCELSFTLRHNLQKHIVKFHGETENVTDDTFPRLNSLYGKSS